VWCSTLHNFELEVLNSGDRNAKFPQCLKRGTKEQRIEIDKIAEFFLRRAFEQATRVCYTVF
jgi:hypothetical protein